MGDDIDEGRLQKTADVMREEDERTEREVDEAQDSLDSRLEREGADQSDVGRPD